MTLEVLTPPDSIGVEVGAVRVAGITSGNALGVISWMTAGKRGRGSRSDSDEGQYPAKKGEFLAYRDRTTNRAPIRPSDHRRVVANQVQRIAAPTRIGYSNAHVSVILPYSGP